MTLRTLAIAGCILAVATGCDQSDPTQKSVIPARGSLKVNGAPAAGAALIFHPVGDPTGTKAHAQVAADGSFELTTYRTGDGAPEGEYVVTVVWRDAPATGERHGSDDPEAAAKSDKLGGRYADLSRSGLRRTVKKGSGEIEPFNLK